MRSIWNRTITATLALLALVLAGCSSVPAKSYYALMNDARAADRSHTTAPPSDRPVVVPPLDIAVAYDSDRIVYRTDVHAVERFNYRLWVGLPQDMLRQLLVQKLEQARIFRSVEPLMHSSRDAFLLLARIDAIELIYDGDLVDVRLAMALRLRDSTTDRDVWTHDFDTMRRIPGLHSEVDDAVRTLSAVYNDEIDHAFALLAEHVSRSR